MLRIHLHQALGSLKPHLAWSRLARAAMETTPSTPADLEAFYMRHLWPSLHRLGWRLAVPEPAETGAQTTPTCAPIIVPPKSSALASSAPASTFADVVGWRQELCFCLPLL